MIRFGVIDDPDGLTSLPPFGRTRPSLMLPSLLGHGISYTPTSFASIVELNNALINDTIDATGFLDLVGLQTGIPVYSSVAMRIEFFMHCTFDINNNIFHHMKDTMASVAAAVGLWSIRMAGVKLKRRMRSKMTLGPGFLLLLFFWALAARSLIKATMYANGLNHCSIPAETADEVFSLLVKKSHTAVMPQNQDTATAFLRFLAVERLGETSHFAAIGDADVNRAWTIFRYDPQKIMAGWAYCYASICRSGFQDDSEGEFGSIKADIIEPAVLTVGENKSGIARFLRQRMLLLFDHGLLDAGPDQRVKRGENLQFSRLKVGQLVTFLVLIIPLHVLAMLVVVLWRHC